MKFRPRFSVLSLLLCVAAVAIFCGYYTGWIRQRHELRNLIRERFADFDKMKEERGTAKTLNVYLVNVPSPAPSKFLWLFGEKNLLDSVMSVPIYLTDEDSKTTAEGEIERAKSLFPEAKQLIVSCYRWGPKKR